MYRLSFYVPVADAEKVKSALFEVGAGRIGHYDSCSWETLGQGQFRALAGSHPAIGKQGELETLSELRVEMVCTEEHIRAVVATLKLAHPYEEVAYHVVKLANDDL